MKRLLCLWLPNWPIQRLFVAQPELRNTLTILHWRDARRGQRVAACCRAARRRGVRVLMPLAEATALAQWSAPTQSRQTRDTGPMTVRAYDWQVDRDRLQQLALQCQRFSPVVGLESSGTSGGKSIDPLGEPSSLLLDLTGVSERWGGEGQLARELIAHFSAQGYWLQLGVADTLGAAWALAHYPCPSDEPNTGQAVRHETISGMRFQQAYPGQTQSALATLPVAALRIEEKTVDLLHQLGVTQIGQLTELPRDGLAVRLGAKLIHRCDQALGAASEMILAYHPHPSFCTHWDAEHPTHRRATIEQVIKHLCHHLDELLTNHQQGALQLRCRLHYQNDEVPTDEVLTEQPDDTKAHTDLVVNLFSPTTRADHFFSLLETQLESLQLPGKVATIRLTATATAAIRANQHQLWDLDARTTSSQTLASFIDGISNRLGPQVVGQVRLLAGILPEEAYEVLPLTGPAAIRNVQAFAGQRASSTQDLHCAGQRPILLLPTPRPIRAECDAEGRLQAFRDQGDHHQVVQRWGPERLETRWWRGPCVRRDYYRVLSFSGARFWLFHDLRNRQWFLHGHF